MEMVGTEARMRLTLEVLEALGDLVPNVAVVAEGDEQGGYGHRSHYHYYRQHYPLFPSVIFLCLHLPMPLLHHWEHQRKTRTQTLMQVVTK